MRYTGVNRMSARGVRVGPSLARTLRGYIETTLSDLIPPNTIVCKIQDGDDLYGMDDFVECEVEINRTKVKFHIEGTAGDDPTKPQGLSGVEIDGNRITGPNDPTTWKRIEQFVRFASK
jgi:hypothetical protein